MSDALLGPAAVVNRMVRLHGSDHLQLRKAIKVLCRHMLSVFNAPTPIRLAMRFRDITIQVEDGRDGGVPDRMGTDFEAGSIGFRHAVSHEGDGMHLV